MSIPECVSSKAITLCLPLTLWHSQPATKSLFCLPPTVLVPAIKRIGVEIAQEAKLMQQEFLECRMGMSE
jgi:hypothetical protein